MSPFTVGVIVFGISFFVSLGQFLYTGFKFTRYIKEKYPEKWNAMDQDIATVFLFPFRKESSVYFIYKSKETFDDEKIADFRKTFRRRAFAFFVVYPLGFISFIILFVLFLETFR
jgi:hypothetical protein